MQNSISLTSEQELALQKLVKKIEAEDESKMKELQAEIEAYNEEVCFDCVDLFEKEKFGIPN